MAVYKKRPVRTFLPLTCTAAWLLAICLVGTACGPARYLRPPIPAGPSQASGSGFYKAVLHSNWNKRDSLASAEILRGNLPSFLKKFRRITVGITDSATGRRVKAWYYVAPDYLGVGNDDDWARVPLTPMASQKIADSFNCFLPTRKMVDDIYRAARVRLAPLPLTEHRDSSATMWLHHRLVDSARAGKRGLIAGIKKDVVTSSRLHQARPGRVAIYGWHKLDGSPIQPLYTGHVDWYVDYSHGTRLIYRTIWINGQPMDYVEVLKHPLYARLLCDEPACMVFRYPY